MEIILPCAIENWIAGYVFETHSLSIYQILLLEQDEVQGQPDQPASSIEYTDCNLCKGVWGISPPTSVLDITLNNCGAPIIRECGVPLISIL